MKTAIECITILHIQRLVAVRAPHAHELPAVRVVHHHAAIAIPVGDEQFVRFTLLTVQQIQNRRSITLKLLRSDA